MKLHRLSHHRENAGSHMAESADAEGKSDSEDEEEEEVDDAELARRLQEEEHYHRLMLLAGALFCVARPQHPVSLCLDCFYQRA